MKETKKVISLLCKLNSVFQGFTLNETAVSAYIEALRGVDIESLEDAVSKYIRVGEKFPTPNDLINIVSSDER